MMTQLRALDNWRAAAVEQQDQQDDDQNNPQAAACIHGDAESNAAESAKDQKDKQDFEDRHVESPVVSR